MKISWAGKMRWLIVTCRRVAVPAAAFATAAGTALIPAPAVAEAQAAAVVCVPENRVCAGVESEGGQYHYSFRVSSAPRPLTPVFTVNGEAASGSAWVGWNGSTAHGEFRPNVPLASGDEVCMLLSQAPPGRFCDTVP